MHLFGLKSIKTVIPLEKMIQNPAFWCHRNYGLKCSKNNPEEKDHSTSQDSKRWNKLFNVSEISNRIHAFNHRWIMQEQPCLCNS